MIKARNESLRWPAASACPYLQPSSGRDVSDSATSSSWWLITAFSRSDEDALSGPSNPVDMCIPLHLNSLSSLFSSLSLYPCPLGLSHRSLSFSPLAFSKGQYHLLDLDDCCITVFINIRRKRSCFVKSSVDSVCVSGSINIPVMVPQLFVCVYREFGTAGKVKTLENDISWQTWSFLEDIVHPSRANPAGGLPLERHQLERNRRPLLHASNTIRS